MKTVSLNVSEVQVVDGVKQWAIIGHVTDHQRADIFADLFSVRVLKNGEEIKLDDGIEIEITPTFGGEYTTSCFNYGHDVKARAHFKSSQSGTSRADKDARRLGFDNADDMAIQIAEWRKNDVSRGVR